MLLPTSFQKYSAVSRVPSYANRHCKVVPGCESMTVKYKYQSLNIAQNIYLPPQPQTVVMSNTPAYQIQNQLLQYIAALHEHKPGHRRDLSIEAMTKDLARINSSPGAVVETLEKSLKIGVAPNKTSQALKAHSDSIPRGDAAATSSSVAGVAGSQQD